MPTHTEQNLSRETFCQWGSRFMCTGSQVCQPQSRSVLCFLAKLPTNPIPCLPPMQSLLNYKEGAKRDPVQHNSVFLHDSPITAKEEGAPACCSKERRKECVTVNGPSSECGKLGRLSCFYLRTIDWWLFSPRQDTHLKRLKACCVNIPK